MLNDMELQFTYLGQYDGTFIVPDELRYKRSLEFEMIKMKCGLWSGFLYYGHCDTDYNIGLVLVFELRLNTRIRFPSLKLVVSI